nr:hypothetical protein [Alicyclobacillus macrosporangiidus]
MSRRLRAAIVGATGMAGQQFVMALSRHPNFTWQKRSAPGCS